MLYDCFTFFNELDLLEIRLNVLNSIVDKFVLVEATKTHKGDPRELVFEANRLRFEPFLEKIIYVVVDDMPEGPNAWVRENFHRNAIVRGLVNCKAGDRIMISDLDEIPRPAAVVKAITLEDTVVFMQDFFYYYLNCKGDEVWKGTRMLPFEKLGLPQDQRFAGRYFVKKGGWHFSYQGGVQRIIHKLESFAHQEFNSEYFKDPTRIEQAMREGKDLFGRSNKWDFVDIDDSFPEYIRNNQDKLSHMIFTR